MTVSSHSARAAGRLLPCLAMGVLALTACQDAAGPSDMSTPVTSTVTINNASLTVGIAASAAARQQGLMGVTRMAADSGMLFAFADDRQRAFWMKDTPIPLSIAFLDAGKKIIFLADMAPNTTTVVGGFNAGPMRYAIEVNQGWFASHGVTVGMYATFSLPSGLIIESDP
jgi:uncharacterized membrane protein (UPF0127 family)